MQDLRLLSELQRLLLRHTTAEIRRHGEIFSQTSQDHFVLKCDGDLAVLQLASAAGTNVLSLARVKAVLAAVQRLHEDGKRGSLKRLVITGNEKIFSAGADLNEISQLSGPAAFEFSRAGQALTLAVDRFPVPVTAAIRGYCMGGGMDLALACDYRIASPDAVFGHRGASLGVITGWGGTQRLPRLIGKTRALQMFLLAEMVSADEALRIGLVDRIAEDPVAKAVA